MTNGAMNNAVINHCRMAKVSSRRLIGKLNGANSITAGPGVRNSVQSASVGTDAIGVQMIGVQMIGVQMIGVQMIGVGLRQRRKPLARKYFRT